MGVNEARHYRFAAYLKYFRSRRNAAFCSHALDAVVFDDHVRILQNFITLHRHHGGATEHDRALGSFPGNFQIHRNFLDVLLLLLEFFLFFFLLFLFIFLRVSGWCGGIFLVRVFGVGGFLVVVFLIAFFLFVLRRFEGDGAQRFAKKTGAHRPGHGLPAIGPSKIVGANVRQPLHRHNR